MLSNGPGDPMDLIDEIEKIYKLSTLFPTLGISLGHQLVALAYGAKTEALPFGHRGGNYPVKDLRTGKLYISRHKIMGIPLLMKRLIEMNLIFHTKM